MRIGKYSFVMIKERGIMLVEMIKNRSIECGDLPDKIFDGFFLNPKNIGLTGETTKKYLNLKTCSMKELDVFLLDNYNYASTTSCRKEWAYLDEAVAIINRDFFKENYYFDVRKITIPEMVSYSCTSKHFNPFITFEVE